MEFNCMVRTLKTLADKREDASNDFGISEHLKELRLNEANAVRQAISMLKNEEMEE